MSREMSVAGAFYPADAVELGRYFAHFSKIYDEQTVLPDINTRAVIVPHAGYIYSGYTANIAYRILQRSTVKNFVVIGPSHKVAFTGISLCDEQSYDTPLGSIQSSNTMIQELREKFNLKSVLNRHVEHSTEVQFPFIKHYIKDAKIVELVYGRALPEYVEQVIDFVLQKEDWGVIISTDLSHFYSLHDANQLDNICLSAIDELNIDLLHRRCEACGMIGVEAMLLSAKKLDLKSTILDYRTSADASDDTDKVVGYVSACFSTS